MADPLEKKVLEALGKVRDPDLGKDIVSLGFVKDIKICDGVVAVTIELTTPACPVKDKMKLEAIQLIQAIPGVKHVNINMTAQVRSNPAERKQKLIPSVRNVIPVASGKGGVGKSTVSANIAVALAETGARVGLMDADVYGPSIPIIMGCDRQPGISNGKVIPLEQHGVKLMSFGFFLKPQEAAVWRGPMLHKVIEQFLGDVDWGDLDYLIVDLPPGTGDVQLSLCQIIPLTGAVIVSTPQEVALTVAQKAISMFRKLNCPVVGIVENMSHYVCSHCGNRDEIFGSGGVKRACDVLGIPFLGEIPLSTDTRLSADKGTPIVKAKPESLAAQSFMEVAKNLAAQISIKNLSGANEEVKITF